MSSGLVQIAWKLDRDLRNRTCTSFKTDNARTETTRTLIEDSRAWVLSMVDTFVSVSDHLIMS
jgi:hypothetical protein